MKPTPPLVWISILVALGLVGAALPWSTFTHKSLPIEKTLVYFNDGQTAPKIDLKTKLESKLTLHPSFDLFSRVIH